MSLTIPRLLLAIYGVILAKDRCVETRVIVSRLSGATGGGGSFVSPDFPRAYPLDGTIYEYYVSNTNPSEYVQLVFTDFLLNAKSILYVFNLNQSNETAHGSVYRLGERPVYHSSGPSLKVIFKTGTNKSPGYGHSGFRATYSYLNYTRETWVGNDWAPKVGVCGDIHSESAGSGYSVTTWSGSETIARVSCGWAIPETGHSDIYLAIDVPPEDWRVGNNSDTSRSNVVVRKGVSTAAPIAIPATSPWERTYIYKGAAFHIALTGLLSPGQLYAFAYSTGENQAIKLLLDTKANQENTKTTCEFKRCSLSRCVLYGEPCRDIHSNADSTCDSSGSVLPCKSGSRCFSPATDVCDSYDDCSDRGDEANCGLSSGVLIAIVAGCCIVAAFVITIIAMCLILRNKRKKKKEARCAQLSSVFSKGLCCSGADKPSAAGSHSNIVNSPSGESRCEGGVSNGGLQHSNMNLPAYREGSSVFTVQNGLHVPHDGVNVNARRGLDKKDKRRNKADYNANPIESQASSRASSTETLPRDQPDGPPNYDWLTFFPQEKKKSRRRRKAKPPQTLVLPRPVSFPSAIVVTHPSPDSMPPSQLFVVESPPSCEEVASFMSGTGLDPLALMENIRPRAHSLQHTANSVLRTDL